MLLHCATEVHDLNVSAFYEPDIDDELTAIAIGPSLDGEKHEAARLLTKFLHLVGAEFEPEAAAA